MRRLEEEDLGAIGRRISEMRRQHSQARKQPDQKTARAQSAQPQRQKSNLAAIEEEDNELGVSQDLIRLEWDSQADSDRKLLPNV